jgi:hypothetical protein
MRCAAVGAVTLPSTLFGNHPPSWGKVPFETGTGEYPSTAQKAAFSTLAAPSEETRLLSPRRIT